MADEVFNAGDVVRLKSGGPAMTVLWAARDGESVTLQWWNFAFSKFETDQFLPSSVKSSGPDL